MIPRDNDAVAWLHLVFCNASPGPLHLVPYIQPTLHAIIICTIKITLTSHTTTSAE